MNAHPHHRHDWRAFRRGYQLLYKCAWCGHEVPR